VVALEKRSLPTKELKLKGWYKQWISWHSNKILYGENITNQINATGKDVIVIGGGDIESGVWELLNMV
jgi:glutamate synthase (NADPH/NADH) small chain